MKNNKLPIILIIASIVLLVINFIDSDTTDKGFWMRIASSLLLILAMILTIKNKNNETRK